jgi:prepilin-type N-terminal cleavage/methylation domain-containing protein
MVRSSPSSSQSGFALIEVIVSAAVLAMVALAVLSGIDGATHASGRERARSVAASLAEQDQERLRSMTITQLAGYEDAPRTVTVDGIDYTVASTTRWVRDATGNAPNCNDSNPTSDYLHVRTTVTSRTVGTRTQPVTIDSIVAPPIEYSSTTGTLVVKVTDQAAQPVPNLAVAIAGTTAGTTSDTQTTNDAGCALFEHVPKGTYTSTLNRIGWVDMLGNEVSQKSMTINAGQLAILPMTYASAATVNLNVKTYYPCFTAGCTATEIDSKAWKALNIINSQPMRDFPQPPTGGAAAAVAMIPATKLFPFTDKAYGFWTGNCANQNPEKNGNTGYFNAARSALPTPGQTLTKSVWQPPLNIRVMKDSAGTSMQTSTRDIRMRLKYDDGAGCTDSYEFYTSYKRQDSGWSATNNYGWPSRSTTAYDPGVPYGDYTLCVLDNTANPKKAFIRSTPYQNRLPTGNATLLQLYNGSTNPFTTSNTTQTAYSGSAATTAWDSASCK